MSDLATRLSRLSPAKRKLLEARLKDRRPHAEPIAIVGMGCRFPGVRSPDEFWQVIHEGRSAIGVVPPSRWDAEAFYDPDGETAGKMSTKWGAFVEEVDQFDPVFFGISPREASRMDPQQRLLLEVAWESLEQAGMSAAEMAGSRTGVFVGIGGTDYSKLPSHFENYLEHIDAHVGTGNALSIAANRISYIFDFRGPSFAVDTACSSALVALHCAAQALQNRECDAALAGGVNLILSPEVTIAFSKARMLSPDGVCRPFDAAANGYVRGEGCGLVVLKRLSDAQRDGDQIMAVIRGTAINQDGKTSGITAPNGQSQQQVIRAALARAQMDTDQISYIEAHGTGTPLGDPIETQSLASLFPRLRDDQPPCYVTSVKANIGHTETVSGIAGLIKTVLAMKHGVIPPQLHLQQLNPNLSIEGSRIQIPETPVRWNGESSESDDGTAAPARRVAGVSSFGFGGTNAHIVLEEPAAQVTPERVDTHPPRDCNLMTLSARDPIAIQELASQYASAVEAQPSRWKDLCALSNRGRSHLHHRCAVLGESSDEIVNGLNKIAEGGSATHVITGDANASKRAQVAFLFTGQGSQYAGMGQQLYRSEPVFRRAMRQCDELLSDRLGCSLLEVIFDQSDQQRIHETCFTQPALFAIEYGLAQLWMSWGIRPDIVLGHSVGEYVAACIAGVFSLEDGLALIAERGRLMHRLPRDGKMAVVFARPDRVADAIGAHSDHVSIAAINGPENTVISGRDEKIDQLIGQFEQQGIKSQPLTVSHAFHSPLMEPILEPFRETAGQISYHAPRIKLVSNLTANIESNGAMNADYWVRHIRDAVRFADGMEVLTSLNPDVVLESGPSPHLIGMARRFVSLPETAWVPSLRNGQDESSTMLRGLAEMHVRGVKVDWKGFHRQRDYAPVSLPTYPFQRSRHWFEPTAAKRDFSGSRGPLLHPLLGSDFPNPLPGKLFENTFSSRRPGYLRDHQVQGSVVVPAAAYLEMALAAAEQQLGRGNFRLRETEIQQAMFIADDELRRVQSRVSDPQYGTCSVECYSASDDDKASSDWTLHARTTVESSAQPFELADAPRDSIEAIRQHAIARKSKEEFYELIAQREMVYGANFQILGTTWRTESEAVAEVDLPEAVAAQVNDYHLHPAILDGCIQASALVIPLEENGDYSPYTYMPVGISQLTFNAVSSNAELDDAVDDNSSTDARSPQTTPTDRFTNACQIIARRTGVSAEGSSPEQVTVDLWLLDSEGETLVELKQVTLHRVGQGGNSHEDSSDWLYQVHWRSAPLQVSEETVSRSLQSGQWLIVSDGNGVGKALADRLSQSGAKVHVLEANDCDTERLHAQLSSLPAEPPLRGIFYTGALDLPTIDASEQQSSETTLAEAQQLAAQTPLQMLQTLARSSRTGIQTWMITRGAIATTDEEASPGALQSTLWGISRVAAIEHPELDCRLIDLEDAPADQTAELLCQLASADDTESQIAVRNGQRYVGRLAPTPELVESSTSSTSGPLVVPTGVPSRLTLVRSGSVDGLHIQPHARTAPHDDQVEIEVHATGLNFSDVLKSLGLYPGIKDDVVPMGIECSGVVTAVGSHVTRFRIGDEVLGVVPYGFATHALTSEYALVSKPRSLSHEEAAAVPITFLTAHHALRHLADLQPGERVLIHAGAGGVGLAAIQIAKHVGAEIYSTAGSEQKRGFLKSLGVDHVMNSRTLEFADEIHELTEGRGVDVVLNSLPGEAIDRSLSVLAAYGRFLEIGKTDIYRNRRIGLAPFQDNLSYFAIDLDRILRQRPGTIERLFKEVMECFEQGVYQPLPITSFTYRETRDAFRFMAQRRNIGKIVVTIDPHVDAESNGPTVDQNGTYLITGGLGALGRKVAQSLIDQGVSHLALLSRREPDTSAKQWMQSVQHQGASVAALQGDVAELNSLREALQQLPGDFPPIHGVVHAAGVLDDGVIYEMSEEALHRVLRPKLHGAWNLHLATLEAPLDHFVLFSSIASLLGSPGQANYAAGNAFLDSLARHRRARGLPATSINWGPWAESGMAAREDRQAKIASRGMQLLPPEPSLELMHELVDHGIPQVAVMRAQWHEMLEAYRGAPPSLLRELLDARQSEKASASPEKGIDQAFRNELESTTSEDRQEKLRAYFLDQLSQIMGLQQSEIDQQQPLNTLGLDSLMAIELKNQVETRLGVVLPMARFMEGPSVRELAEIVSELVVQQDETTPLAETAAEDQPREEFELSYGQQALWFLYRLAPTSAAYHICDAVRVRGPLNVDVLRQTTQQLVDRHAAFRTTFHDRDGKPYQRVQAHWNIELDERDGSEWSESQWNERISSELHRPFDLETGPLLRVSVFRKSDHEHVLLFCVHHIIADFWSLVACTQEFLESYGALSQDREIELAPLAIDYRSFVRWQSEMLEGEEGRKHWEYWRKQLSGELPVLNLPTDRPRPPVQSFRGHLAFRWLSPELTKSLRELAEAHGTTLNTLLLATYQTLLHRYSGQDDVIVGLPTSGRSRAEFAPLVGYFVNPVPVRTRFEANPSFTEVLGRVRRHTLDALNHQDFPFSLLVDRLHPQRDPSRSTLFQAAFVMQKAQVMHEQGLTPFLMGQSGATLELGDLTFESMTLDQWVAQLDLSLAASEANGGTSLGLQYNSDLFDHQTAEEILDHYQLMLEHIAEDPETPVAHLPVMTQHEQQQWREWNATEQSGDVETLVHERIRAQAEATPEAIAVVCGEQTLTFAELDERANRLAHYLQSLGAGPNERIGLCLPRSVEMVVAIQAILRSGAAYVPLDPTYPSSRLHEIASSAAMSVILTTELHRSAVEGFEGRIVYVDREDDQIAAQPTHPCVGEAGPDDLIYVIYTSGSTGTPKGAGVYHRGFANLMNWYLDDLGIGSDARTLIITSHGFDLTQKNLYATLMSGGQLHLSTGEVYDPQLIADEIKSGTITLLNCTPSHLYGLAETSGSTLDKLQTLQTVVLGGEPIELTRLEPWLRRPDCQIEIVNSYGPTECTDVVIYHRLRDPLHAVGQSVPLGRPIRNVQTVILDDSLGRVPLGATGELCLAGACLGAGYINDAEMTADRFVTVEIEPGIKRTVYRTGDLCRYRDDGVLEFLGRKDHQVKLRGFRIELGEIESVLLEHPAVRQAVALVREDVPGVKQIVAYLVPAEADHSITSQDLKAALREQLPLHMIPSAFVLLDRIPLTPHGKLDRRSLPQPRSSADGSDSAYVAPANEREELLASIWSGLLGRDRISATDSFFDLGGDSLLTIQVVAQLGQHGWHCTPAQVFQYQTLRELAAILVPRDEPDTNQSDDRAHEDDHARGGRVPLLPSQRWFFELGLQPLSHFNQAVMLEVPPGLSVDCMRLAVEATILHHDALHCRFEKANGQWNQRTLDTFPQEPFASIDLSELSEVEQTQQIEEQSEAAQQSLDIESGRLVRVLHFDLGNYRPARLLLLAHHLVVDPYSWRILLEDLLSSYQQALGSQSIELPPKTCSQHRFAEALESRANRMQWPDVLERWQGSVLHGDASLAIDIPGKDNRVETTGIVTEDLSPGETARFLELTGGAPDLPLSYMLAALGDLHMEHAGRPLWVDVERHGRDPGLTDLDVSRTIGWFVVMHPVLAGAADASDLQQQLRFSQQQLENAVDKGNEFALLRYFSPRAIREEFRRLAPIPNVRLNYLGQLEKRGVSGIELQLATEQTGNHQPPKQQRPHLLEVDARIRGNRLSVQWTYSRNFHRDSTIVQWAERFNQKLRDLLRDPSN